MARFSKAYFFTGSDGVLGRLFRTMNKPKRLTYEELFNSLPFINDSADTAKTTEAGHIKKATDAKAMDRDDDNADGHERGVVPHQLPVVLGEVTADHVAGAPTLYQGVSIALGIYTDPVTGTTRRDYFVVAAFDDVTIGVNGTEKLYVRNLGIDTAQLAAASVTLAKMDDLVEGSLIIGDATNRPSALAHGTDAQILISNNTTLIARSLAGAFTITNAGVATLTNDVVTLTKLYNITQGALVVGGVGDPVELAPGAATQILISQGATGPIYAALSGAITITIAGVATIPVGYVTTAMMAPLLRGRVLVGNVANVVSALDASGNAQFLIGDGNDLNSVILTGDITVTAAGVVTIIGNTFFEAGAGTSAIMHKAGGCTMAGNWGLAVGQNHTVAGSYNIVGGENNVCSQGYCGVFGQDHNVIQIYNLVGGTTNNVQGIANVVGGDTNTVTGAYNGLFGQNHVTTCAHSLISGLANVIAGNYHIIGGNANNISGNYHMIHGLSNTTGGGAKHCMLVGELNDSADDYNILLGYSHDVNAGVQYTIVTGYDNTVNTNGYGAIFGRAHTVNGFYNIIAGWNHTVTGTISAVFGQDHIVANAHNIVAGYNHDVSGGVNACFGWNNVITGGYNFVTGQDQTVAGGWNVVGGRSNTGSGDYCLVVGYGNDTNGMDRGATVGTDVKLFHNREFAYSSGKDSASGDRQASNLICQVQTGDNVWTVAGIGGTAESIHLEDGAVYRIEATFIAVDYSSLAGGGNIQGMVVTNALVKNNTLAGGAVTIVGGGDVTGTSQADVGMDIAYTGGGGTLENRFVVNGTDIEVQVKGIAATDIEWIVDIHLTRIFDTYVA